MFESAELEHAIDRARFEEEYPNLRTKLLNAQFDLIELKKFPVILIVAGMEGTGVIDALTGANKVLDSRHVVTFALDTPTQEESERPRMWRFWRRLPRRGHIAIFDRSWYCRLLVERVEGFCSEADWRRAYNEIKQPLLPPLFSADGYGARSCCHRTGSLAFAVARAITTS